MGRSTTISALLAVILAVALPPGTLAQPAPPSSILDYPDVRELATAGISDLYDLRLDAASARFETIGERYPEHPVGPFLQSLTTWWTILLDLSDESNDHAFFDAMDEVIRRCDRLLKRDPDNVDARFFKGAALGFRGRLRSNRGDWFKAAMDGKRAMDYVLAVPAMDPGNDDYAFGKGIYDYFAAVVPEKHPFVKPVMGFFPRGDRDRGLQLIERTASKGHYIQTEAVYFLVQIHFLYERNYPESLKYARWLVERYPNNAFFRSIEARILAQSGRWAESAEIYRGVLEKYKVGQFGYNDALAEQALYYIARERMIRRSFDEALTYLLQLEALSSRNKADTYFKVLGRLRQGMAYDALGQRDVALQRYREVLRMKDWASAHERAKSYLDRPYR